MKALADYVRDVLAEEPAASVTKIHRLVKAAVAVDHPWASVRRTDIEDILSWLRPA